MSRYIDADNLKVDIKEIAGKQDGKLTEFEVLGIMSGQPTADVRENVKGEWEHWGSPFSDESEVIDTIVCSVCGARFIEPKDETKGEYNYCPNCGADMRGQK